MNSTKEMKEKCGTPGFLNNINFHFAFSYMAPELFLGKGYNAKVDVYSLGILLFIMSNFILF